jgi:hypothetical protein
MGPNEVSVAMGSGERMLRRHRTDKTVPFVHCAMCMPLHEAKHIVCGQSNSGMTTTSYNVTENLAMRKLNLVIFSNFSGAFILLQAGCRFGPLSWPGQVSAAIREYYKIG